MLTLSTVRKALWNYGSSVPYSAATPTQVSEFDFRVNMVMEKFFSLGTWKSMWKRPILRIYGNKLTLPRGFDTAIGADPYNGPALPIYSEFNRFASQGARYYEDACSCRYGLTLINDGAQTFIEPDVTFTIRAVGSETIVDGLTFTGGFDENDTEILGTIHLDISAFTPTETTQKYTKLPDLQKAVTDNAVYIYFVNVDTSVATLMAVYAPGETTPAYRQYLVGGGLEDQSLVRVLCKLGFEPAISPNDLIIPGNMNAIMLGLHSLQFQDRVDPANGALYMGPNYPEKSGKMTGAIDLLDSEIAELNAAEQVAFQVSPDFGSGSVVNVI